MRLIQGDCLKVLGEFPENSIDSIVTDPPYGLAFMGNQWDYSVPNVEIWRQCLRVLKPGGHLLSFAGTRTQHRMAVNIEDAGFEIRDMVAWVHGQGFPKSLNLDGEWQGWGTALKPAFEPVTVARKPLAGTVAANVLTYRTGALNVDGCRVGDFQNTTPSGVNKRNAMLAELGYRPSEYQMEKKKLEIPLGRWPANLIHDGSEEVVKLFPELHGAGAARTGSKNPRESKHKASSYKIRKSTGTAFRFGDSGSAARFFYCAKASKGERGEGNNHPTVKPVALMRYLCRLATPPGGILLDPFMGSGTTGIAAKAEGFFFVGIEREAKYFEIATARIEKGQQQNINNEAQMDLF